MSTGKYPEHDKLSKIKDVSQAQGAFLDWLQTQGLQLCTNDNDGDWWTPSGKSIPDLLAAYHEIDQDKLEKEKQAMLEEIRAGYEESAAG